MITNRVMGVVRRNNFTDIIHDTIFITSLLQHVIAVFYLNFPELEIYKD